MFFCYITEWWYGPVLCKIAPYLQGVAVSASVNTLAAVAIERYVHKYHNIYIKPLHAHLGRIIRTLSP